MAANAVPPGNAAEVRERTGPIGQVCRVGDRCGGMARAPAAAGGAMSGQQVYDQFCFACHATGVTDAPRFGNAEDWAPRIAKGVDTLLATTISGLNFMPVRGTCMPCSDEELRAAVDYLVETAQ